MKVGGLEVDVGEAECGLTQVTACAWMSGILGTTSP